MRGVDAFGAGKVCDCSRHSQHTVIGAHRQRKSLDGLVQQCQPFFADSACGFEPLTVQFRVAYPAAVERYRASRYNTFSDRVAALATRAGIAQGVHWRPADFDAQIDTIE